MSIDLSLKETEARCKQKKVFYNQPWTKYLVKSKKNQSTLDKIKKLWVKVCFCLFSDVHCKTFIFVDKTGY